MLKLYYYDHCPYCVKARMIFGLKNMAVEEEVLLNDDEDTPTKMIGKKMVPILRKEDGSYMPESMDIVHYVEELDHQPVLQPLERDGALQQWLQDLREVLYPLAMPRWIQAPLAEFASQGAIEYFKKKKEGMIGDFDAHLSNSATLKAEASNMLAKLEPMIDQPNAVRGALCEDDLHLFAALRCLSIVAGLEYPERVEHYRQTMAREANVPLHDTIAVA